MINFERPASKKEPVFKSDPNSKIIDQLSIFRPGKSPDFTALQFLHLPEDIRRYYKEAIALVIQDQPDNVHPERVVYGNLDYISRYGEEYQKGWERFKAVLGSDSNV